MKKTIYTAPECEIVKTEFDDVIATSIIMPPDIIGRGRGNGYPEL